MIELANVTHARGDTPLFSDLSLTIPHDSCTLILGANGAGKTTFLDLCSGISSPDEGVVRINGIDTRQHPAQARMAIGRVFESPDDQLLGETVERDIAFGPENLGLSLQEIDERVNVALTAVGMERRRKDAVHTLSGGEAARVAIAGALAMDPDHLMLDEPTAGIDFPGQTRILAHLSALRERGLGIVMATHDIRDLGSLTDRVIVLDSGQIVIDGAAAEVDGLDEYGVRVPSDWPN